MNQLAKSFLCSVAVLAVVGSAHVARADMMENLAKTTPQERAEIQTAYVTKKLQLTEAETAKVAQVNLEYAQKAEPVIKGSDGAFSKMRQMKEVQSEKNAALKGVLSPAQYETYEASQDEMKEKFEEAIASKVAGRS